MKLLIHLNLDAFTSDQTLAPGLSVYGELNLKTIKLGSLFNSIVQITGRTADDVPNIVVSSVISKDPSKSEFKAHIAELILLGNIQFSDITFSYKPVNKVTFGLMGTVSLMLGSHSYDFLGEFTCMDDCSKFVMSPTQQLQIIEPLGMWGVSLNGAKLQMVYTYPQDKPHTSSQIILATVNFNSKEASSKEVSPSTVLECSLIFYSFTPTVVKIALNPTIPLRFADFVKTVFAWDFDVDKYLDIGLVNGQVYYAKLEEGRKSIEIDGQIYQVGYHISANIEIFSQVFVINADITSNQVSIDGYAHSPLNLGFAKLTGIDDSDPSKPDKSKSPQILFVTNSKSTSTSLNVGFVLFEYPLGTANLGFKSTSDKDKLFFGQLTYHGKIGFIKNPSIEFQWSEKSGFRITNWPAVGSLMDAFDFFNELRNYKDDCGALVDLAFKEGVQTQFNINISLAKTQHSDLFLADIEITGTYDVLLLKEVKIASVPIPDIKVGIPIEDNFSLDKLPKFILDLFAKNATLIVQQITEHPDRLAKILAISVLKYITKEVVATLTCRNVDTQDINPTESKEDFTKDDFEKANEAEKNFKDAVDNFRSDLKNLKKLAEAAAKGASAAKKAIDFLAGIGVALASIGAFFFVAIFAGKKKEAEERKKRIEDELNDVMQKMRKALDIGQNPTATFAPPNKLTASWKPIEDEAARYHVRLEGTLLTSDIYNSFSQVNTSPVVLYDDVLSSSHLQLQNERLYNVVGLRLSVNGTITVDDDHTFNGDVHTIDVLNVHPTLHAPSNMHSVFHHPSLQIVTVASPVQYAEKYHFELINSKNEPLVQCMVTSTSISNELHCSFPHSAISSSSGNVFRVRGQTIAKSGTNIASSDFGFSDELAIVSPVRNLQLVVSHFGSPKEGVELHWELPTSIENIVGFLGQVVEEKTGTVLLSKDVSPIDGSAQLSTTCKFSSNDIDDALTKLPSTLNAINLAFKVNSTSNSKLLIDSVFDSKAVSSLPSPQRVTCTFVRERNALEISWMYTQLTKKYGIEITDGKSEVAFSKLVEVKKDPDIESGKVGCKVPMADLHKINDPSIPYTVQVTSVADGNDTMDSLVPSKAENTLQVLHAPLVNNLQYTFNSEGGSVTMSFAAVKNTTKYLTTLFINKQ